MNGRPGRPRRRRRSRTRGFTLVELMVAIAVMTIGILGLASTAAVVTRMMSGGAQQTIAANVVQARFEKLRNRQCSAITSGDSTTRHVRESWTVSFPTTNMALVIDSVQFTAMSGSGVSTPLPYRSYVPCVPAS